MREPEPAGRAWRVSRLVGVNSLVLATLALGFVVTIVVPRFAIERLGIQAFGVYAVIAGFAGIMAFADLGLIPGITRALAGPVARGDSRTVDSVMSRVGRVAVLAWIGLSAVSFGLLLLTDSDLTADHVSALLLFLLGAGVTTYGDIQAALLRVAGRVSQTYLVRIAYLLLYASLVTLAYASLDPWPGIWVLCLVQLMAAIPCTSVLAKLSKASVRLTNTGIDCPQDERQAWREAWKISSPERLTRVLGLAASIMERPLLFALNGPLFVASYDLLNRIALVVSAIPGALSQPLMSMLAHDSARAEEQRRFGGAYELVRMAGFLTAGLGLAVALTLWTRFHTVLFGVPSVFPPFAGVLVLGASALNVLTAPGVAYSLSAGKPQYVLSKLLIEMTGMVIGFVAAIYLRDAVLLVAGRFAAIALGAAIFLSSAPTPKQATR